MPSGEFPIDHLLESIGLNYNLGPSSCRTAWWKSMNLESAGVLPSTGVFEMRIPSIRRPILFPNTPMNLVESYLKEMPDEYLASTQLDSMVSLGVSLFKIGGAGDLDQQRDWVVDGCCTRFW